jgi:hypothetical protein
MPTDFNYLAELSRLLAVVDEKKADGLKLIEINNGPGLKLAILGGSRRWYLSSRASF